MKKKIISLLLSICMLVALLPVAVYAEGFAAPTMKIDSNYDEASGVVTLKVLVGKVSDMAALQFAVEYNKDKLSVTSSKSPAMSSALINDTGSTIAFAWSDPAGVSFAEETVVLEAKLSKLDHGNCEFKFASKFKINDKSGDISIKAPAEGSVTTSTVTIPAPPVPATGITLDKNTLALSKQGSNNTAKLTATVTPENTTDTVMWSSSDTKVATVDANGNVTAVGVGTATITAKAGDKTATCTVTVSACDHKDGTKHEAKAATCTEDGNKEYYDCANGCGAVKVDGSWTMDKNAVVVTKLGHKAGTDWVKDADNHWHVCERCKAVIDKAAHNWKAATCTEAATCTTCGATEGKALGHQWDKGVVTTLPTIEKDGVKTFTCSVCKATKTEAIPKLDSKDTDQSAANKAANDAADKIHAVSGVAKPSKDDVKAARDAFNALSDDQKKLINEKYGEEFLQNLKTDLEAAEQKVAGKPAADHSGRNYPAKGGSTTTTKDGKTVESGKTFDAGIALYVGLSVLSVTGGALVISKKKEF